MGVAGHLPLAISHMHADHTGNANDYAGPTWLVQEAEREVAFRQGQDTSSYRALADSRTTVLKKAPAYYD